MLQTTNAGATRRQTTKSPRHFEAGARKKNSRIPAWIFDALVHHTRKTTAVEIAVALSFETSNFLLLRLSYMFYSYLNNPRTRSYVVSTFMAFLLLRLDIERMIFHRATEWLYECNMD